MILKKSMPRVKPQVTSVTICTPTVCRYGVKKDSKQKKSQQTHPLLTIWFTNSNSHPDAFFVSIVFKKLKDAHSYMDLFFLCQLWAFYEEFGNSSRKGFWVSPGNSFSNCIVTFPSLVMSRCTLVGNLRHLRINRPQFPWGAAALLQRKSISRRPGCSSIILSTKYFQ